MSRHACSVKNCNYTREDGISLFSIPQDLRKPQWLKFLMEKSDPVVNAAAKYLICEYHFKEEDISREGAKPRVNKMAIPVYGINEKPNINLDQISSQNLQELSSDQAKVISNVPFRADNDVSTIEQLCAKNIQLSSEVRALKQALESEKKENISLRQELQNVTKELMHLNECLENCPFISPEQLKVIRGANKVDCWSDKMIRKGLKVKMLGKAAIDVINKEKISILPSNDTINRRIREHKSTAGIQENNLKVFAERIKHLPPDKRKFGIVFDEKAIKPDIQMDPCTKKFVGKATLDSTDKHKQSNPDEIASHVLVFQIVGIEDRYKEIASFEFTAGSTKGLALKECLFEVIRACESIADVQIVFVGCDMSADNVSMLGECGVKITSTASDFYFQHPFDSSRIIYVKPDDVHNIKNLICGLRKHIVQFLEPLASILSSEFATFDEVKSVFEHDSRAIFKFDKNLTSKAINPGRYDKMREKTATAIFSQETLDAIKILTGDDSHPTLYLLQVVKEAHRITTDREGWDKDSEKYQRDIITLKHLTTNVFPYIRFVSKKTGKRVFKKSLYALIVSMKTLIHMSQFLFDSGATKVIPARFLTVSIENFFGLMGTKSRKFNAVMAAHIIRTICVSGFHKVCNQGSYSDENDEMPSDINFLNILRESNTAVEPLDDDEDEILMVVDIPEDVDESSLFTHFLERAAFQKQIQKLMTKFSPKFCCNICSPLMFHYDNNNQLQLTSALNDIILKTYHCFNEIANAIEIDSIHFKDIFLDNTTHLNFLQHCRHVWHHILNELFETYHKCKVKSFQEISPNVYASRSML